VTTLVSGSGTPISAIAAAPNPTAVTSNVNWLPTSATSPAASGGPMMVATR
jgi:hypothetical protein